MGSTEANRLEAVPHHFGGLILGSLPAVAVIHFLDGPILLIAIGVFVLLGLGISLFPAEKFKIPAEAKGPLFAFGMAGGFMSTMRESRGRH